MDIKNIAVTLFIVLNMKIEYACCAVFWNMTTDPAVFGKDIILTCYTFYPLKNSKDCPVRQWSGGTDGRGLMYNGLSSNKQKYEEKANLLSSQFSLIIRNLSTTDINVKYTCSCGFFAYTNKLKLDEQHFQYSPDNAHALISTYNVTLKIKIQMTEVYPLPTCSVHIGGRVVSNKVWLTYRKSGFFYSVSFVAEYKLFDEDCNKKPRVQCDLRKDQILFEGNITHTCPDYSTETSVNEIVSLTEKKSNKQFPTQNVIAGVICVCILLVVYIHVRKRNNGSMGKMCQSSKDLENADVTDECILRPITDDLHKTDNDRRRLGL